MSIVIAELIGTFLLVLLGNGVVANVLLTRSKGHSGGWISITAGWGFAVAIAVYATGWISGGHFNPAVTLGFVISDITPLKLVPYYLMGQFAGAMLGALAVWLCYFPHWEKTESPQLKLLCFATDPAIRRTSWNLVTEIIGTAVLLVGVLAIFNEHNGISRGFGPYAVGILVFSIGLSLGGPTGYAINPARDLGPRIMYSLLPIQGKGSADWRYAWVPVIGPLIGSILGTLLYKWCIENMPALKALVMID